MAPSANLDFVKPLAYSLLNVVSASGIVFANKAVFQHFDYKFTYALTLIHTLTTMVGMRVFASCGMFTAKKLPTMRVAPLAAAYVGYIVFCNLNLKINNISFYQITKIAVAPAVLLLEFALFRKRSSMRIMAAIALVCVGVAASTVTDRQVGMSLVGLLVGAAAVAATALYQIWAGSKQRELRAGSMQLLHQYSPLSAAMLAGLVLGLEPIGWRNAEAGTLLGYTYSGSALVAIFLSAVLGLLVSLSTFLVIGATSSLTYNVIGHVKTVIILTGGCIFFGDEMPMEKLFGILVAMSGIVWYSLLKLQESGGKVSTTTLPLTDVGRRGNGQPSVPWRQHVTWRK